MNTSNDQPTYLMNPATGSVDTKGNWLAEMPTWPGPDDENPTQPSPQEQFESLIEVVKNKDGDWVEPSIPSLADWRGNRAKTPAPPSPHRGPRHG